MREVTLGMLGIAALAMIALLLWPFTAHAQATPINRTLQAAATSVGPGLSMKVKGYRYKSVAIEIAGSGSIRVECSVDDGTSYDIIDGTTLSEVSDPPCGAPPNRCLLDVSVTCTDIRTPIVACNGCTITSKLLAEP